MQGGHGIDFPFNSEVAVDGMVSVDVPIDGIGKRCVGGDEILCGTFRR